MKKFLVLLALAGLFVACTNDEEPETPVESGTVTLSVSLNATSFMAGETITATITDVSSSDVTRGDITLNFSVIDTDAGTYAEDLFASFPETAVFSSTAASVSIDFVFSDTIDKAYNLRLVTSADGCTINGSNQNIIVSTVYVITLSIPEAEDNTVYPGDEFTIQAYTENAPSTDVTISLTYTDGAEAYFDALPESVTIKSGETTGATETITAADNDGSGEHEITVSGVSDNSGYEATDYSFKRGVKTSEPGESNPYLLDETYLYTDPAQAFVSADKEEAYKNNGNSTDYVVMTRADKTDWTVASSAHPTASLANEGWTLLNACEFHYGFNGWGLPSTSSSSWGVNSIRVQNGWSTESTGAEQLYAWQSDQNEKYTDVKSDGYVRIWAAYDQGDASIDNTGAGTTRYIGTDSPKCLTGTVLPSWAVFETGTRIEVRARLGGKRQGFAPILRLRGNASSYDWPVYGEIDFMANPVYTDDPDGYANKVHQAVRWSDSEDNYYVSDDYELNIEDWNIYWVEITDGNTLKMGINGQTTYSTTGSGAYWPFCTTFNTSGLYLQVSLGVANAVRTTDDTTTSYLQSADWADSSFKTISYDASKTSEDTPHMDIDWVRVWRNGNHGQTAGGNGQNSGVYFF